MNPKKIQRKSSIVSVVIDECSAGKRNLNETLTEGLQLVVLNKTTFFFKLIGPARKFWWTIEGYYQKLSENFCPTVSRSRGFSLESFSCFRNSLVFVAVTGATFLSDSTKLVILSGTTKTAGKVLSPGQIPSEATIFPLFFLSHSTEEVRRGTFFHY